ncbi:MAG: hypothetical protein WC516_03720 [Patescibacteria group bacterium]
MFFIKKTNYERSNSITKVPLTVSNEAINYTQLLLKSSTISERQELGEKLLDELSDAAQIGIIELKIADQNQQHRKVNNRVVMKRYGLYKVASASILIQNKTAVRGQTLAAKTFVDTLLHEWLHHYDIHKLKLNSIHSKGFYLRLNDLKEKLKIV